MKASFAIVAVFAACIHKASAQAAINTAGVATSCGQNTCCVPSCMLAWTDSNGCNGDASTAGACSNAFYPASDTDDTGVDICDGSGAFFCITSGGDRVVYVANSENTISAALWPAVYNECTESGQCAPCPDEASCEDPVTIGTLSTHSCSDFAALLTSSGVNLATC